MKTAYLLAGLAASALLAGAAQAGVTVTYENPGVVNTTASFSVSGKETFDSVPTGTAAIASTFGGNGVITGNYSASTQVNVGDQYGGEGGSNYAVTFSTSGYELTLSSTSNPGGVTYFGYYLPALDNGNQLELWSGGSKIFDFNPAAVHSAVDSNPLYFGKPDAPLMGANGGEPYVFVNFFATGSTLFDKVVFKENPTGGGYESDNHTVGYYLTKTGHDLGVPEPTTWALMLLGFGGAGASLRASRRRSAAATA